MKGLLKTELYKAVFNPMFFASTATATAFAIGSFIERYKYESAYFAISNIEIKNPCYEIDSLFNQWIAIEGGSSYYHLFFMLLPLFASIIYSWSYPVERKSGVYRLMAIKGKRGEYLLAKYLAVFISAALSIMLALIVNICLCATYFPIISPDVFYDSYYGIGVNSAFRDIFYTQPAIHMIIYSVLISLYSGLFAVMGMTFSYVLKNKYVAVFLPFFVCLLLSFINAQLKLRVQLDPTSFLHPGATLSLGSGAAVVLGELIIGLLITIVITIKKGSQADVF